MVEEYARLSIHRWMLLDEVRNEAYRRAISQVVKPGDTVLDMGAGTGILSIFAAQAGATKVHAVERTDIAVVARKIIERNGLSDRIEVHQTDLEDVVLPGKVDVIISEWMGGFGVDENMLAPLVIARDRWLRPGGRVIPERVTALLAPMWIFEFDDGAEHWRAHPHGVDLSVISELTANETIMAQWPLTTDDLLAPPQVMWSHDALACSLEEADRSFEATLAFTATRDARMSGLAAWFDAAMCEGVSLTNAVGAPATHWGRFMFPLNRTLEIREGALIRTEIRCESATQGSCDLYWSVQVDDGPIERHDTRPRRAAKFAPGG
jgi:SAM-dependent methyltransferase